MKLSLIAAGLAIAVSTFAVVELRHMTAATATANPAETTAVAPPPAPLPQLLPVPTQIGGQKIAPAAQEGVSCLIDKKNDKDACGDMAMKREIAKCVGGIGVQGGCFDFFNKKPISAEPPKVQPRRVEQRRANNNFHHFHHLRSSDLRMLASVWF
jgi:hypothetical protein